MPYRWVPQRDVLPLTLTGPQFAAYCSRLAADGRCLLGIETYPTHLEAVTAPVDPRDMRDLVQVSEPDVYCRIRE